MQEMTVDVELFLAANCRPKTWLSLDGDYVEAYFKVSGVWILGRVRESHVEFHGEVQLLMTETVDATMAHPNGKMNWRMQFDKYSQILIPNVKKYRKSH
jgi:hypothetical protein